jgi:hypothetical protein
MQRLIRQLLSSLRSLPPLTAILRGFGLLGDRDPQLQHTRVVGGVDLLGVEGVAEEQLPAERPRGPLRDHRLGVVAVRRLAFGMMPTGSTFFSESLWCPTGPACRVSEEAVLPEAPWAHDPAAK